VNHFSVQQTSADRQRGYSELFHVILKPV